MEVFVCMIVIGLIGGAVGSKKGEGVMGFIVAFFLGPIGLLFVILSKGKQVKCQFCRELVHKDATVCKHCSSALAQS